MVPSENYILNVIPFTYTLHFVIMLLNYFLFLNKNFEKANTKLFKKSHKNTQEFSGLKISDKIRSYVIFKKK